MANWNNNNDVFDDAQWKSLPSHEDVDISKEIIVIISVSKDVIVIIVVGDVYMGQTAGDFSDLVRVCTHSVCVFLIIFHQKDSLSREEVDVIDGIIEDVSIVVDIIVITEDIIVSTVDLQISCALMFPKNLEKSIQSELIFTV